jgi:hypothetical protein
MSQLDATGFLEVVRKDRTVVEKVIGLPSPTQLNKDDIVKIGADMGYHFSLDELHDAVGTYLMQHASELNTADLDYLKAAGGC